MHTNRHGSDRGKDTQTDNSLSSPIRDPQSAIRNSFHVVGVAGVGMSALAQALVASGARVTGSDRYHDRGDSLDILRQLARTGIAVVPQDGIAVTASTTAVVVSTAIEDDNPDIAAARRLNIPVIHRAAMLAKLVEGRRCVAITGTCGKSTVTGMVGWILEQLGADPTVVNGAPVLNWRTDECIGNVRIGKSALWVIEADESDRSLLQFHPDWALITNVSKDHFEYDETRALFDTFARQARNPVLDASVPGGILDGFSPEVAPVSSSFRFHDVKFHVPLPGRHNAENALCAVALCERMGYSLAGISDALAAFKGIHRRLELIGKGGGVTIIDDYAHNPAKIEAAWRAVQPANGRMFAVWRPHGYKPLATMLTELQTSFRSLWRPGDRILVLPVYDAGGTASRTINSDALTAPLQAAGVKAAVASDYPAVLAAITDARPGDTILVMGARDPHLPELARAIVDAVKRIEPEPRLSGADG
jgi:UDP-N-acetylmuramate--alanine ligase